jgi:hypothetical protein
MKSKLTGIAFGSIPLTVWLVASQNVVSTYTEKDIVLPVVANLDHAECPIGNDSRPRCGSITGLWCQKRLNLGGYERV